MINKKTCTHCYETKEITDFYLCSGNWRGECKACTIKKTSAYQKENKTWLQRVVDREKHNAYQRAYYAKNKKKMAQYRKKFEQKHPGYHKTYRIEGHAPASQDSN